MFASALTSVQRTASVPEGSVPVAGAESAAEAAKQVVELDPISLALNASGLVFVVVWLLVFASIAVWFIAALKFLQLRRWRLADEAFERAANKAVDADSLFAVASRHRGASGSRVVLELQKRRDTPRLLDSAAKRAMVAEQKRASGMMPTLASIGSASPFIGLLGTVYGIMDAFLRIGREKSASLPVVAPAIGEALIATAVGLIAAIPAVIAYNAISNRLDDLLSATEASAEGWVQLVMPSLDPTQAPHTPAVPLTRPSDQPPMFPGA
jgi:biopolymer transport protein TolQ